MPAKTSEKKEEYFARMEYERKKRIAEEKQQNLPGGKKAGALLKLRKQITGVGTKKALRDQGSTEAMRFGS